MIFTSLPLAAALALGAAPGRFDWPQSREARTRTPSVRNPDC